MTEDTFAFLAGLVRTCAGIVLTPDKAYMLETRLAPLLARERLATLDALALRLRDGRSEALAQEVVEALTTNESSFFRDGKPFEHLCRVLPRLAAARPPGQPLRVWSAAWSTGQEAYSAAMIAADRRPVSRDGASRSSAPTSRARCSRGRARVCSRSSRSSAVCRCSSW